MWRPSRHPAAFTPLSETIGIIVSACHEVLRKVVRCEPDDAVSLAALKTFAIAASNTDFTRLDPALLPNDLRALLARLDQLSMEPGTATEEMLSSTLTCVSVLAAAIFQAKISFVRKALIKFTSRSASTSPNLYEIERKTGRKMQR
jgi:hypothetical protein